MPLSRRAAWHRLVGDPLGAQQFERGGHARFGKCEALPQRDGRRVVAQADYDDGHVD
jgi:hypothetical protein